MSLNTLPRIINKLYTVILESIDFDVNENKDLFLLCCNYKKRKLYFLPLIASFTSILLLQVYYIYIFAIFEDFMCIIKLILVIFLFRFYFL